MSFLYPVKPKVLAALEPPVRRELEVWSRNHARIFDLRLHSMKTCPFLAYWPARIFLRKHTARWAAWLHKFYRHKHEEEGRCNCDAELAGDKS